MSYAVIKTTFSLGQGECDAETKFLKIFNDDAEKKAKEYFIKIACREYASFVSDNSVATAVWDGYDLNDEDDWLYGVKDLDERPSYKNELLEKSRVAFWYDDGMGSYQTESLQVKEIKEEK